MRKPTVLVVLDEAMTAVQRTEVTNVIQQSNEFAAYTVQVTPTKLSQTSFGVDPWSVINCPMCERQEFVTIDLSSTWCAHCNAQFVIRTTAGDEGFVVDCRTHEVSSSEVKNEALIGKEMYRVVKTYDGDSQWLVKGGPNGISSVDLFLKVHQKHMNDMESLANTFKGRRGWIHCKTETGAVEMLAECIGWRISGQFIDLQVIPVGGFGELHVPITEFRASAELVDLSGMQRIGVGRIAI